MKLREYRKKYNIRLLPFAAKVGISAVSISRIERGKQRPSMATIEAIVRATDNEVQPADFFEAA